MLFICIILGLDYNTIVIYIICIMDDLLDKVQAYLIKHSMTATDFGWACNRNPNIVFRLRKGQITLKTINDILTFIEENPKGVIPLKKTAKKAVAKKAVAKKPVPKVVKKAAKKKK